MSNKPLSKETTTRLSNLDGHSKALLIPALVEAGKAGDTRANYATNMLFAPPGFVPADIVPGVINQNHCGEWIHEMISDGHDIDWEDHEKECEGIKETGYCDCDYTQGTTLLGDWKRVDEWRIGKRVVKRGTKGSKRHRVWVEDKDKKDGDGFSAVWHGGEYGTFDITVTWSKWVYRGGRWGSPCIPGQASIPHGDASFDPDTDAVACYILSPDLHLCFECATPERKTVYAAHFYGAVLCDVCCERHGIDFKTGELKGGDTNA